MLKLIVVITGVLLLGSSVESCSEVKLMQCIKPVEDMIGGTDTLFQDSEKAKKVLTKACPSLIAASKCLKNVVENCQDSPTMITETFEEILKFFIDLCQPGPFQTRYFKHSKCMESVNDEVNSCQLELQRNMRIMRYGSVNQDELKTRACRLIHNVTDCAYMKASNKCGDETGEFFKEVTTRIMKPTMRQLGCSESLVLLEPSQPTPAHDGDIISQNLTAVWEALHGLSYRLHELEQHHGGYYAGHRGHHAGHRGHSASHNGHHAGYKGHHAGHNGHHAGYRGHLAGHRSHHTGHHSGRKHKADSRRSQQGDNGVINLMHDTGVKERVMGSFWIYFSDPVKSSTLVISAESSELVPAFTVTHNMYIRGHRSGSSWCRPDDDYIQSWNSGGTLAIHIIHKDGRHEELLLGDTEHNHKAQYTVVIPGGTHHAMELQSGDFVLTTRVSAPVWDMSKYNCKVEDEMMKNYPQYEAMIRRLRDIRNDDKLLVAVDDVADHHVDNHHNNHHD